MKRVLTIALALGVLTGGVRGQITSISGELRYQHQYQDVLSGDILSRSLRQSPMLSLNAGGNIIAPQLVLFNLSTSLAADFNDTRSGLYSFQGKQYLWDYYNLSMGLLQYSPVKVNIMARENVLKARSDQGVSDILSTGVRRQEQQVELSTYKIKALPSTSIAYGRDRSWSIDGTPYNQINERYSLGMSTSNGGSSVALNGSISDMREQYSGLRSRYSTLQFFATRNFGEDNRLDIDADYDRYDDFSVMSGNGTFTGSLNEQVRLYSSVYARNSSSAFSSSDYIGVSQGVQVLQDPNWRYSASVSVKKGKDVRLVRGERRKDQTFEWSNTASVQNTRALGFGNLSNSLSVSYSRQRFLVDQQSLSGGFSSGIQSTVGPMSITAGYGLSGGVIVDGGRRYRINNTFNLTSGGTVTARLQSETSVYYNDDRYSGNVGYFNNQRSLQARQSFVAPFTVLIPFNLAAGGSVTWLYYGLVGRTYGWNVTFNSSSFFLMGLSAYYRYSRTFDPYYVRESVEQNLQFKYQWRALLFEIRLREYRVRDRIREFWFSLARPFSV